MLAVIPLALGGKARCSAGALEVCFRDSVAGCGTFARCLPFRAIVFGHVILAVTADELRQLRPHERVHVAQYERWGVFFFVAYAASGVAQACRGRSPYWHNHFEIEARRSTGSTA